MALFPQKKPSSSRGPSRRTSASLKSPTLAQKVEGLIEDQRVLPRLLLVAGFIALMILVLRSWEPLFPHRIGDRADHGLTARIDFKLVDEFKTEMARQERANAVAPIFIHDPEPLQTLPPLLRQDLEEVARASRVDELSEETRVAFRLVEQPDQENSKQKIEESFAKLQAAVGAMQDMAGTRIDDIILQFDQLLAPLDRFGLVDPAELARLKLSPSQTLTVIPEDDRSQKVPVSQSEVRITDVVQDTGKIGKNWTRYPDLNRIRPLIVRWLQANAPVTLAYDADAVQTAKEQARETAPESYEPFSKGQLLLPPGGVIDDPVLTRLRVEHQTLAELLTTWQQAARVITAVLLLIVLVMLNGVYLARSQPDLFHSTRKLAIYLTAVLVTVAVARWVSVDPWRAEVIPLLVMTMIFAIAYSQALAAVAALTITLIIVFSTTMSLTQFLVLLSVCATAIIPLSKVHSRVTLVKVGALSGLAYFVISFGTGLLQALSFEDVYKDSALLSESVWGFVKCLVAGYFVAGTLPFIEAIFGVVTDISLLEMSDPSHPLLQELIRRAPGTYSHSNGVATIGEAAANAIGANGLLLRVAAYFHDVGKMLKPNYFIENVGQGRQNKHDQLAPAMSTLIIIGHVKDGVELARQHDLPQQIVDFIEQHHGTTLVEYFYRQAESKHKADPDGEAEVLESSFRYPGPKPQTKETAVMMLADAVEASSRTLSDPTPKRIEGLVHGIAMKKLLDGQFDESPLTLTEIHVVEQSLIKSLTAIYHGRIKYPDQQAG